MARIDPETVFPTERALEAVRDGEMTQITRGRRYAEAGDAFEIDGSEFEVVAVVERTLGDLTDADARREGSPDLDAYRERLVRAHGGVPASDASGGSSREGTDRVGDFEWDDDADVVTHRVRRSEG